MKYIVVLNKKTKLLFWIKREEIGYVYDKKRYKIIAKFKHLDDATKFLNLKYIQSYEKQI